MTVSLTSLECSLAFAFTPLLQTDSDSSIEVVVVVQKMGALIFHR